MPDPRIPSWAEPAEPPIPDWAEPVSSAPAAPKPFESHAELFGYASKEMAKGLIKSVLGTIQGGGQLIRSMPVVGPLLSQGPEVTLPISTQPSNPTQAVGKTVGNLAQFVGAGNAAGRVADLLTTGSKALNLGTQALAQGAAAGATQSAQQGTTANALPTAAIAAGTTAAAPVVLGALKGIANRTEGWLVNASKADYADGFRPGNVFKYDLGGSLAQTYEKATAKMKDLTDQLKQVLKSNPAGQVDVADALATAAKNLGGDTARKFGQNAAIQRAVSELLDDPWWSLHPTGVTDLAEANQVKQGVGELGAWLHQSGRVVPNPDANAKEIVANAFYTQLKTAIEQQSGNAPAVQAINKQLGEIIPIRNAVIRRIPVEARQAVLNIGDLISFSTGHLGVSLLNRALRSGEAANILSKLGSSGLAGPPMAPALVGGGIGQALPPGGSQ